MKYVLGIWSTICLIPILLFLFQDQSIKGVSRVDLKNTLLIFIGGVLIMFLIRKGIKCFK
ncbi:hypothetical protein BOQ62_14695 [Chryseobacterium sp. CH21]|nr:hypothetical protein BOQ62_14695 [Chryseobacterium sp. CH21]